MSRSFLVCRRCYDNMIILARFFFVTVLSICRHCYAILVTVLFVLGGAMIFLSRFFLFQAVL